ncbi:MAG: Y-family DNA polymerase, partial [Tannerella sp.]|nr:Y-family DNA polymerase [Tannerella sp.]
MFALVDCNNFYCSCERVFRPDLIGKPVLVLSNNDGCVVARSAEVKALGVKMGVPLYQIESLVKQHDIAVFSSNYVLYGDMSNRVMSILSRYAPNLENYSIDESFLDFSGMQLYDLYSYSRSIALTVLKSTGIPVCVGVGQSKTLAKLANYFAKHYKAYKSVCIIDTDDKRNKALKAAPIDEVWGIGRKYAQLLQKKGVVTAYDFVSLSQLWVRNNMSIVGEKVWKELQGVSCLPLESVQTEKKSICTSRSFGKHLTDFEELATAVSEYAALCAAKLRRQKTAAVSVMV